MDGPYRFRDDLPHGTLNAANQLDTSDYDLPENDWLPIATDTRWQAAVRLLSDLEDRRGLDTVRILLAVTECNLDTDEIERALQREDKLVRSNKDPDRRGGRPSKVDHLARRIATHCRMADRDDYEDADDQTRARDRQIKMTIRSADISRRTFYNLRDRVLEEHSIDISEIAPPSKVMIE